MPRREITENRLKRRHQALIEAYGPMASEFLFGHYSSRSVTLAVLTGIRNSGRPKPPKGKKLTRTEYRSLLFSRLPGLTNGY